MNGFLILGALIILVAGGLLYHYRARVLKAAAEEVARIDLQKAEAYETGIAREAAWEAFNLALEAKSDEVWEADQSPEFIVSKLVNAEDYPRFGVLHKTYEVEPYQKMWTHQRYGISWPANDPPELPRVVIVYEDLTDLRFEHQREAEHWLELFLNPKKRQWGFDAYGKPMGGIAEPDAELDDPLNDA